MHVYPNQWTLLPQSRVIARSLDWFKGQLKPEPPYQSPISDGDLPNEANPKIILNSNMSPYISAYFLP